MAGYFGSDLGTTSNPCTTELQFYLGRVGYGTSISLDWNLPSKLSGSVVHVLEH